MSAGGDTETLPSLDAFDDEFGREHDGIVDAPPARSGFRLSTVIGLALAAGVISALALGGASHIRRIAIAGAAGAGRRAGYASA